jgi:uncharacterized protein YegP (UPF0339 family)
MYESVASRDNGIESVKKNAPEAKPKKILKIISFSII